MVDTVFQTGGAEWFATQIALLSNSAVFEFVVVTWNSHDSVLATRLRSHGVSVFDATAWRRGELPYGEWKEIRLFDQLSLLQPDIVLFSSQYLYEELPKDRLASYPTIVRISNFHVDDFAMTDFAAADRVICTTREQLKAMPESHAAKARMISTGIDIGMFQSVAASEKDELKRRHGVAGKTVVLFVARLGVPLKRTPVFQEVVRKVQADRDDITFVVAGYFESHTNEGEDDFRQFVLDHDVLWEEGLPPWEMPRMFQMADILISTSAAHEGLSNTVLQALACGVVPVVTASAGMRELVVPGETGYLVESDDAASITNALLEAVDLHDAARARLAEAGRRRAEDRYSLIDSVTEYQRAFLELHREQPTKVCITDGSFNTGGAEWLAALLILNSDPAEVRFELVMHRKHTALVRWLEERGVALREAPGSSYTTWRQHGMREAFRAIRPDVVMPCTITTWPTHTPFYRLVIISQNASDAARLTREQYDEADYFICVSEDVKQHLSTDHHWKMTVLHNSTDVEMFRPDPEAKTRVRDNLGVPQDVTVALWCGRLHEERKRPDVLRKVIAEMCGDDRIHFLVIGYFRGDEGDQDGWREFVRSHQNITWVNEVAPWETPEYYAAADVYLSTSGFERSDFEGLSVATVQALATALPVVTTLSGGQRELVEDGVNGRLVDTGDVCGLVDAIREVAETEPDAFEAMQRRNREKALTAFDIRRHARQYSHIVRLIKNTVGPALAVDPDESRRVESFLNYTWPLLRERAPGKPSQVVTRGATRTQLEEAELQLGSGDWLVVPQLCEDPDGIRSILDYLGTSFPLWSRCERHGPDLVLQKR